MSIRRIRTVILCIYTDGEDYEVLDRDVTFEPLSGEVSQSMCRIVHIINDIIPEISEQFSVALMSSDPDVILPTMSSLITILDDDGNGYVLHMYSMLCRLLLLCILQQSWLFITCVSDSQ